MRKQESEESDWSQEADQKGADKEQQDKEILKAADQWNTYIGSMVATTQTSFLAGSLISLMWFVHKAAFPVAIFACPIVVYMVSKMNEVDEKRRNLRIRWRRHELVSILGTEIAMGLVFCFSLGSVVRRLAAGEGVDLECNYFLFLACSICYHKGEGLFVLNYHPREFTWTSYLIYHSKHYFIAFISSQAEFVLGYLFMNPTKSTANIATICVFLPGLLLGLAIRQLSFYHCKSNFHHLIRYGRDSSHRLVTTGVYGWDRHPSYFGFFLMSISMQCLLKNPFNTVAFVFVLSKFFRSRIQEEEYTLCSFFGNDYVNYMERVPSRLNTLFGR